MFSFRRYTFEQDSKSGAVAILGNGRRRLHTTPTFGVGVRRRQALPAFGVGELISPQIRKCFLCAENVLFREKIRIVNFSRLSLVYSTVFFFTRDYLSFFFPCDSEAFSVFFIVLFSWHSNAHLRLHYYLSVYP